MSKRNIFTTIGASNHTDNIREPNDYYASEPKAMQVLLNVEQFNNNIWECACGEKHLANELTKSGYNVRCSDIVNRCDNEILDFLSEDNTKWDGDIITNPPFKYALEFAKKGLEIIPEGNKLALFLKLQFLEGKTRKAFFTEYPPKFVYVSSSRLNCAKNGDFDKYKHSALSYCWFVWEKGYKGDTIIKWIN